MLVTDLKVIGNKLYSYRKAEGLTQEQAAERAAVSTRTYADVERGSVNTRVNTLLKICKAFAITPDELLTEKPPALKKQQQDVLTALHAKDDRVQESAYDLLSVYLKSLENK